MKKFFKSSVYLFFLIIFSPLITNANDNLVLKLNGQYVWNFTSAFSWSLTDSTLLNKIYKFKLISAWTKDIIYNSSNINSSYILTNSTKSFKDDNMTVWDNYYKLFLITKDGKVYPSNIIKMSLLESWEISWWLDVWLININTKTLKITTYNWVDISLIKNYKSKYKKEIWDKLSYYSLFRLQEVYRGLYSYSEKIKNSKNITEDKKNTLLAQVYALMLLVNDEIYQK